MRSSIGVRNRERGQSSVEYILLVALSVFAIIGLAQGYRASIGGVTKAAQSSLAAASGALPGVTTLTTPSLTTAATRGAAAVVSAISRKSTPQVANAK